MLTPRRSARFKRDLARMMARGNDGAKLRTVIEILLREETLDPRYRDHKLKGPWVVYRECHVEPDWLLIYQVSADELLLERTGTHTDLFGR